MCSTTLSEVKKKRKKEKLQLHGHVFMTFELCFVLLEATIKNKHMLDILLAESNIVKT